MPEDGPVSGLDEELAETEKKAQPDGIKIVKNSIKDFILESLLRLREEGLTYEQIGKRLALNPGQVHQLLKGKWYPKTETARGRAIENHIFEKLTGKPNNSNGEGNGEKTS